MSEHAVKAAGIPAQPSNTGNITSEPVFPREDGGVPVKHKQGHLAVQQQVQLFEPLLTSHPVSVVAARD